MAVAPKLRVATLNVRGLAAKRKQSQVYRLLVDHDLDVLAVQETKVDGEEETRGMVLRFTARYHAVVSQAIGTSAGCVLFIKKLPGLVVQDTFSCPSGRLVSCDFVFNECQWRIVCIYAPTICEERSLFFFKPKAALHFGKEICITG